METPTNVEKMTSAQFRQGVIDVINSIPLKELFQVEEDITEKHIQEWLTGHGVSDYLYYVHFYESFPMDKKNLNVPYYIFEIAHRIILKIINELTEDLYWNSVFHFKDFEYQRGALIRNAIEDTLTGLQDSYMSDQTMDFDNLRIDFLYMFEDIILTYPPIEDLFLDALKSQKLHSA